MTSLELNKKLKKTYLSEPKTDFDEEIRKKEKFEADKKQSKLLKRTFTEVVENEHPKSSVY